MTAAVAAIEAAAQDAKTALDPELLARLEAAIEQLSRDESTAKVVGLVEERVGAGVRAVVERSEATGRAVEGLGETQAELRRRLDEVADTLRSASASQLEALSTRLAGIADAVAAIEAPTAPAAYDDERVVEAVRKEAELLTQRVAALAVGVEAARALLQQHVEETENSLGKKAGSVTRRLAADLGFGGRRGRGGGRDRRQLGPGEH
jgi:uncharacterized protein YicC (UPF0701 family)